MSNEIKTITFDEFAEAAEVALMEDAQFDWNGIMINVKYQLDAESALSLVDYIAGACFDATTHEFIPECQDYAVRYGTVTMYTNIELSDSDSVANYKYLFVDDLFQNIVSHINKDQWQGILRAADRKINNICKSDSERLLASFVDVFKNLEALSSGLEQMFGKVSADDINAITDMLANMQLDKLPQAVVEKVVESNGERVVINKVDNSGENEEDVEVKTEDLN